MSCCGLEQIPALRENTACIFVWEREKMLYEGVGGRLIHACVGEWGLQ